MLHVANLGGGAMLVAGLILILLGALIQSSLFEWLLNIIGFVILASGAIIGIVGLVKIVSGK